MAEFFRLLGYYAGLDGVIPVSGLPIGPIFRGQAGCFETSVSNHLTPRSSSEEVISTAEEA